MYIVCSVNLIGRMYFYRDNKVFSICLIAHNNLIVWPFLFFSLLGISLFKGSPPKHSVNEHRKIITGQ